MSCRKEGEGEGGGGSGEGGGGCRKEGWGWGCFPNLRPASLDYRNVLAFTEVSLKEFNIRLDTIY